MRNVAHCSFNGVNSSRPCCSPGGLLVQIRLITSDDWGSYAREVPAEKHLTGKIFTQRIERNNLTLRTRLKRLAHKTICFSRSVEMHENVIGAFIERHHFN